MTPKEKAEELRNRIQDLDVDMPILSIRDACALIVVDEILKVVSTVKAEMYWKQVKQELE